MSSITPSLIPATGGVAGATPASATSGTLVTAQQAGQALFSASSSPSFDFETAYQGLQSQTSNLSTTDQNNYLWTAVSTFLQTQGQAGGRQLAQSPSPQGAQADANNLVAGLSQTGLFSPAQIQIYSDAIGAGFTQAGGSTASARGSQPSTSTSTSNPGAGSGINLPTQGEPGTRPSTTASGGSSSSIKNAPAGVIGLVSGSPLPSASLDTWTQALNYYHKATPAQQQTLVAGLNACLAGAGDNLKAVAAKVDASTLTVAQAAAQSLPALSAPAPNNLPAEASRVLNQAGTTTPVADSDYQATLSWLQKQTPAAQRVFVNALSSATVGSQKTVDNGIKLGNALGLNGAAATATATAAGPPLNPTTVSDPTAQSLLTDKSITTATTTTGANSRGLDFPTWNKVATWLAAQPATTRTSYAAAINQTFGSTSSLAQAVTALNTAAAASPPPSAAQLAASTFPGWPSTAATAGSTGGTPAAAGTPGGPPPAVVSGMLNNAAAGVAPLTTPNFEALVSWWQALPTDTDAQKSYKGNIKAALNAEFPAKDPAKAPPMGLGDALQYAADGFADTKDAKTRTGIASNYVDQVKKAAV